MRTPAISIDDMQVLLDVEQNDNRIVAKVIIGKSPAAPQIASDTVSMLLETVDGPLLRPTSSPAAGVLPESHIRGATASGQFTFEAGPQTKLNRAILFLRGKWAEFKLG